MKRREMLSLLGAAAAMAATGAQAARPLPEVQVYKTETCGCCGAWVEHLQAAGFKVKVTVVEDTTEPRRRLGLPDTYGSCHTGVVGGYVVEGHVPAADIKRLLAEKPAALGLAVPGMPVGSPGMESASGRRHAFDVLLVDRQGRAKVFSHHAASAA